MRLLLGVGSSDSVVSFRNFLRSFGSFEQIKAVAVVPHPKRLSHVSGLVHRPSGGGWQQLEEAERTQAQLLLDDLSREMNTLGKPMETALLSGEPADELIKEAKRWRADLILVTKWRTARSNDGSSPLPGHVAGRVARYSPCSVLVLDSRHSAPRKFLLATDGSTQADKAAEELRRLPINGTPNLQICTVVEVGHPTFARTGSLAYHQHQNLLEEIREQEIEAANAILDRTRGTFDGHGFRVKTLAYTGDATEVLLNVTRALDIDLLTLGAKGTSHTSEFLLGSITLKLLNRAPCSILIVR